MPSFSWFAMVIIVLLLALNTYYVNENIKRLDAIESYLEAK